MLFTDAVTALVQRLETHFLYNAQLRQFLLADLAGDAATGIRRYLKIADGQEPDIDDTQIDPIHGFMITMMAIAHIRLKMSGGTVQLGIKNQAVHLQLDEALRIYARYKPRRRTATYPRTGQVVQLPERTLGVARVIPSQLDPLYFKPQDLSWVGPVAIHATHHTQGYGSIGDVISSVQVRSTEQSFFSAQDWTYLPSKQQLLVTPRFEGAVTVETLENFDGVHDLDYDDYAWVERFAFAGCLEVEGRIRGKYTNDFLQMDGAEMRSEGAASKERLEEALKHSQILNYGVRA